ncbi:LAME_0F15170g1_1 [Lachancea meyersii CBS 8951]|uniref:tRNA:m(4)X modification enzyme TRM13 n=1 Tax=Lachancea meyersii CBS 8951 TaxID=1266667 RepID=A0A1G4JYA5_9SACH|nr:LAME_0F15170g1_1 [Lachancea meyersii CBS 8951]
MVLFTAVKARAARYHLSANYTHRSTMQSSTVAVMKLDSPINVQKVSHTENATSSAPRLQCKFYLQQKNRRCGMTRRPDLEYCSVHSNLINQDFSTSKGRRIPCPIDPRHSVWEKDVARHVRRCNTTKKNAPPVDCPWFKLNYNLKSPSPDVSCDAANEATILRAIPILIRCHDNRFGQTPLPLVVKNNKTLESQRFPQLPGSKKHALQQSSLIQHLVENSMIPTKNDESTAYIEFGCGRAEFSRYVNRSVFDHQLESTSEPAARSRFILIDRASNRMKFDSKFKDDLDELYPKDTLPESRTYPVLDRKKIDIKDLYIDNLLLNGGDHPCVTISKHLCGVATDLTIACCLNSDVLHRQSKKLRGMVIAMCCRHVCDAQQYVNQPFIEELIQDTGISYSNFFNSLKKIASWAVCGRKAGVQDSDVNNHFTNLPVLEREKLGEKARRIIDEGRAEHLRRHGYRATLIRYIEPAISLENVAMIVNRE